MRGNHPELGRSSILNIKSPGNSLNSRALFLLLVECLHNAIRDVVAVEEEQAHPAVQEAAMAEHVGLVHSLL
jgi:hypothetical protein